MNREIRFRAWDSTIKEMLPNVQNHINDPDWAFGRMLQNTERFAIMQFTGLKDKNEVDVWEGDVVKWDKTCYDFDKPGGQEKYIKTLTSYIEYRHNGFYVEAESFGYEGEDLWDWKEMEVIGNVFANPELKMKGADK